jgi:cyclase
VTVLPPRLIPVLLLKNRGLVKTLQFADPKYISDPINAVRIFNEKEVDELVLLDIAATPGGQRPDIDYIASVASEAFMPLAYGGGVRTVDDAAAILKAGVEKIVLNAAAVEVPELVTACSRRFGNQSVVAAMDVRRAEDGTPEVWVRSGRTRTGLDPVSHARAVTRLGAGELFVTSIDRDGTMRGYDLELIASVVAAVDVPVIACGGAGALAHCAAALKEGGASAAAAGSFFVFCGTRDAILITYPDREDVRRLLVEESSRSGFTDVITGCRE